MKLTKAQKGGIISVCIGIFLFVSAVSIATVYNNWKTDIFHECMTEIATIVAREPVNIMTEIHARKFCVVLSEAYLFKRDFEVMGNSLYYDHSVRLYMPK